MSFTPDDTFEFRALLLNIQDSLSDRDRVQLHFLLTDNIPRCLKTDGSLETSLEIIQILLDRAKISKNDVIYLIEAMKKIERHDCAQRLQVYQNLMNNGITGTTSKRQTEIPLAASSNIQKLFSNKTTIRNILDDEDEIDAVKNLKSTNMSSFKCPDFLPLDFQSIDLHPLEDQSHPWTIEYSKALNLPFHPRPYQIEIIRNAIENRHTLICCPTGSGKTYIASILIKYYYIKKQQTLPNTQFTSLFFLPKKAIRLQQANAIASINNLKVMICEEDDRILTMLDHNHVIVTTPQKFVNALETGRIDWSSIDLMILDECHHTSGGDPYCEIMKYYLCPSLQGNQSKKPFIIGLTASISAKSSIEKSESVANNLISLCSKLACEKISTVCNVENLQDVIELTRQPSNDPFEFVLVTQYNEVFNKCFAKYKELIRRVIKHVEDQELLISQAYGSSSFTNQLMNLKAKAEMNGNTNQTVICDYLHMLTRNYEALNDLPFDMIIQHILTKINQYYEDLDDHIQFESLLHDYCVETLTTMLEELSKNSATNSKLDNLITLVQRHIDGNNRGLILVQRTLYAKLLASYLSNHPQLIDSVKALSLVGQSGKDASQSISDQEDSLKKFREGSFNVMVATDIVQEGLDVPTCSFVIRYEFVSDEIGTVQSKGRARRNNSSYYLITSPNSKAHLTEKNNQLREEEMRRVINSWPQTDKEQFRVDVLKRRKELVEHWEKDIKRASNTQMIQQLNKQMQGSICCRRCNREIGEVSWLRKRNTTYFIYEPIFFDNKVVQESEVKQFQEILQKGEIKCQCGNPIGGYQIFLDRSDIGNFCALKCKQIKFKLPNNEGFVEYSQWKKTAFDVKELEDL